MEPAPTLAAQQRQQQHLQQPRVVRPGGKTEPEDVRDDEIVFNYADGASDDLVIGGLFVVISIAFFVFAWPAIVYLVNAIPSSSKTFNVRTYLTVYATVMGALLLVAPIIINLSRRVRIRAGDKLTSQRVLTVREQRDFDRRMKRYYIFDHRHIITGWATALGAWIATVTVLIVTVVVIYENDGALYGSVTLTYTEKNVRFMYACMFLAITNLMASYATGKLAIVRIFSTRNISTPDGVSGDEITEQFQVAADALQVQQQFEFQGGVGGKMPPWIPS